MVTWWVHLSYSHALAALLIVVLFLCLLASVLAMILRVNEEPQRRRPTGPVIYDYSAQYEQKRQWLGERFLLARPINRRITSADRDSHVLTHRVRHEQRARLGI